MMRFFLWTLGGIFLGLMIHLVVILNLPHFATNDLWNKIAEMTEPGQLTILDPVVPGKDNPLEVDPAFAVAICRLDLGEGPGIISGPLPDAFWSVAVFNTDGTAIYSTTHRAASGNTLNLGIFNPAQTRLLAEREIASQSDLLVVESQDNAVFVTIRLAPPHRAFLQTYRDRLAALSCANLPF